jgi:regulatory protein
MNIRAGLEEIDGDDYVETLSELATKRYDLVTESNLMKKRKKVADYLLRKGFESSMIYSKLLELEGRDKT